MAQIEVAAVADALRRSCANDHVPGASAAIVAGGALVRAVHTGVIARSGAPVDDGSVFDAASLTKPVFAASVLRLVERGEFDLDRPLAEVVDLNQPVDARTEQLTARCVLRHASGLPNWRPGRWTASPAPLRFEHDPGVRFGYSGEGFELLRHAVEAIAGESAGATVRRLVLEPLSMAHSAMAVDEVRAKARATGHDDRQRPVVRPDLHGVNAAGSLRTTALDYGRFVTSLVSGGLFARDGTRLMMLATATPVTDEIGWSLGIGTLKHGGDRFVWQWGDDPGWKSFAIARPQAGDGLAVFTNSDRGVRSIVATVRSAYQRGADPIFRYLGWDE